MRRILILIKNLISIPSRIFSHISVLAILQEAQFDKTSAICSGVRFYRSEIGKYSYIGNNTVINDTYIGSFTSIAPNCYIGGTTHPIEWVSTSPVFHKWENIMKKNFARHDFEVFQKTTIGNDVWIGNNVMIKAGVTIADGAVIGMGSIVTKNIGPYEIWAGNPAKLIKKRFDETSINRLLKSQWWNWKDVKIQKNAHLFNSAETFLRGTK